MKKIREEKPFDYNPSRAKRLLRSAENTYKMLRDEEKNHPKRFGIRLISAGIVLGFGSIVLATYAIDNPSIAYDYGLRDVAKIGILASFFSLSAGAMYYVSDITKWPF